jgi:hypothetical protein
MAILNYTTKIDPFKTCGEIHQCLAKHGASQIMTDLENGLLVGISFRCKIGDNHVSFRLPCNYQGVLSAMKNDRKVPNSLCTKEQALRVSWRILKDWIFAQMAIIEAQLATLSQVFLPYAITPSGETLYEKVSTDSRFLLLN